jgi:hypothetical protein
MMIGWLSLTDEQRRTSLAQAENNSGVIAKALEKDWWVTLTLKALFQTPFAGEMVFKGGTSLSKCWRLIDRFSEDIDIALSPSLFGIEYRDEPGSAYLTRLKRKGCEFTSTQLKDALNEQFIALGVPEGALTITAGAVNPLMPDKDPQELYVAYRSLYAPNKYLPDEVKIEAGVRSKLEPFTPMPVRSLLDEYFPNEVYAEEPFYVQAVEPRKTFLEKAFLLHEMFNRGAAEVIKTERISRHFHDLAIMMRTDVGQQALADGKLYEAIIRHRRYYTKMRGVDYDLLRPEHINFYPPAELLEAFKSDYREMLENMIYGGAPSETELFELMNELIQKFRDS